MFFVTQGGRLIFRLAAEPGNLVSTKKAGKTQACAFASGESLDPAREELVFEAALKAKNWDNFVFKLGLEGFEVQPGDTLRLPFSKL
jgi:hypothetical protein